MVRNVHDAFRRDAGFECLMATFASYDQRFSRHDECGLILRLDGPQSVFMLVLASSDVIDLFLDEESESLAELQEFINTPIRFQVESLYTQEQFDVVLL